MCVYQVCEKLPAILRDGGSTPLLHHSLDPGSRGHNKNLVECQGCGGNRQNLNFSLDLHSPALNTYYKLMALIFS